jgi:uncharacterized membrane protein
MGESGKKSLLSKIGRHISIRIIGGILITVPLVLTFWVLKLLFLWLDGFLSPVINDFSGIEIPGLGFILLFVLLYLVGTFFSIVAIRRIWKFLEGLIIKVPLAGFIYTTARQLVDAFSSENLKPFEKFVLVDFLGPRRKSIGFLTGVSEDRNGRKYFHVFMPTPPNPVTGFIQLAREEQLTFTKLTFEESVEFSLSGGASGPRKIS